jgi:ribosomal protein S18 acetylase RimI-like enzyme
MSTRKRNQFVVRELRADSELALCLALEHAYSTDYVWQVDMRDDGEDMLVRFRTVRLPRTMPVAYPRDEHHLRQSWEKRDCFLVAAMDEIVLGYVHLRVDSSQTKGWIQDLVVGQPFRRRKLASALLEQASRWAGLRNLDHLTLEMQTKNYPAICFARKHGFAFCGFNDHYYMNRDIALFFGKNL